MKAPRLIALAIALAALTASPLSRATTPRGEFLGAKPTEYPNWFKESFLEFREDIAEAAELGKRTVVLFHQDGCPYCNQLVEVNLAQKDIAAYVREHFEVIAVNMWGDREVVSVNGKPFSEKTFAAALKVQFTPTLIFFDEGGKVALRLNGYLPPHEFKVALRYVAEKHENSRSYHDFLAASDARSSSGQLHSQPFFAAPPYKLVRGANARPLAVFFEQKDCPNCDTLHSRVLSDAATREVIGKFDVVQLDMWSNTPVETPQAEKTTARDWARSLQISYAPSIVLFDRSGKEVIRSESAFKSFHTQSLFHYVLEDAQRHEPSFQRYISERAEHLREQGITVNIWE